VVESGRECAHTQINFKSTEEREFYYKMLQALQEEGGRSQEEIETLLQKALEEWRRYDE
jgi:hypothetical protein